MTKLVFSWRYYLCFNFFLRLLLVNFLEILGDGKTFIISGAPVEVLEGAVVRINPKVDFFLIRDVLPFQRIYSMRTNIIRQI